MSTDTSARSLAKTVSWRITGSSATFAISYIVLGDVIVSSTIAVIQLTFNTALYFIHERIWNQIQWGQKNF
jgi:uncharacterized membrane protein